MAYNRRRAAAKRPARPVRRNMRISQRQIQERRANRVRREFMRQAGIRVSQDTIDDVLDEVDEEETTIEAAVGRRVRRAKARRAMRSRKMARPNMRRRVRRAQENEPKADIEPNLDEQQEDMEEEKEARRRAAIRRAARKRAMRNRKAVSARKPKPVRSAAECGGKGKDDEDEKEKEARRREARKRALARMRNRRKAQVSDDLTGPDGDSANFTAPQDGAMPSDDLATPDEGDGGVSQTPPASVNEAEDKVLAAYRLIDAQIAHGAVDPKVSKSALASKYCKRYSLKEMRIATQQLSKVGKAAKVAGKDNVRVQRRSAAINKTSTKNDGFDAECVFA